jgi:hypothetical protein
MTSPTAYTARARRDFPLTRHNIISFLLFLTANFLSLSLPSTLPIQNTTNKTYSIHENTYGFTLQNFDCFCILTPGFKLSIFFTPPRTASTHRPPLNYPQCPSSRSWTSRSSTIRLASAIRINSKSRSNRWNSCRRIWSGS